MDDSDLFGVLYIIDSSHKLESRKRIQKMVCIGKYNPQIRYPFSFTYTKYLYGPYSFDLKETLTKLISLGIIEENFKDNGYTYSLTAQGELLLTTLKSKVDASDIEKLKLLIKEYPTNKYLPALVADSKTFFH